MIEINNLHKQLAGKDVLRGVSLRVEKGEFFALIGRSGCGKSVLLKHIAGLLQPDSGRILIDGEDLSTARGRDLERIRRRYGFVFQNGALFDSMTVYDNLAFPLREKATLSEDSIQKKVARGLAQVGLTDIESKFPSQLSGGMIKRTALARALVMEPEIIFFDEPTTGLDPIIAKTILNLFNTCHEQLNLTGIIVSHNVPDIFRIVQKVGMLHDGKIIMAEIRDGKIESENPIIQQFVEGRIDGPVQYK